MRWAWIWLRSLVVLHCCRIRVLGFSGNCGSYRSGGRDSKRRGHFCAGLECQKPKRLPVEQFILNNQLNRKLSLNLLWRSLGQDPKKVTAFMSDSVNLSLF